MPRANALQWQRATPIIKRDNMISSKARETGEGVDFKPSYLDDGEPKLCKLLTDEYMRIWFRERDHYLEDVYTRAEMLKPDPRVKRRFVQKMFTLKKLNRAETLIANIKQRATTAAADNRKTNSKKTEEEKWELKNGIPYTRYKPNCPKTGYGTETPIITKRQRASTAGDNRKTGGKKPEGEQRELKNEIPCCTRCKPKFSKGIIGYDMRAEIFKDDKDDRKDMFKLKRETVNGLQDPCALMMNVVVCSSVPKKPTPVRANGLKC